LRIRGRDPAPQALLDGDPVVHGATLIVGALGRVTSRQTFALPPGPASRRGDIGWRVKRNLRAPGYRSLTYVDRQGQHGPVRLLRLTRGRYALRLEVRIAGDVALHPPDPATAAGAALVFPGGETYCVGFGGPAGGRILANRASHLHMGRARRRA